MEIFTIAFTVIAVLVAGVSALFVRQQATQEQTDAQIRVHKAATDPYVWADIWLAPNGFLLDFVVGNSGPTVAQNVVVTVDPDLPFQGRSADEVAFIQNRLRHGLASLPPGRSLRWRLGPSAEVLRTAQRSFTVSVTCDGPNGQVPAAEHVIDLEDYRYAAARPEVLFTAVNSVKKLTTAIEKQTGRTLRVEVVPSGDDEPNTFNDEDRRDLRGRLRAWRGARPKRYRSDRGRGQAARGGRG